MSTDNLTPHDLDQLSRLIVDALQLVDRDQGRNRGLVRLMPGPRDLGGQLTDEEEEEGADGESEEEQRLQENSPTPPATPSGHRGNFVTTPCYTHMCVLSNGPLQEHPTIRRWKDGKVDVYWSLLESLTGMSCVSQQNDRWRTKT